MHRSKNRRILFKNNKLFCTINSSSKNTLARYIECFGVTDIYHCFLSHALSINLFLKRIAKLNPRKRNVILIYCNFNITTLDQVLHSLRYKNIFFIHIFTHTHLYTQINLPAIDLYCNHNKLELSSPLALFTQKISKIKNRLLFICMNKNIFFFKYHQKPNTNTNTNTNKICNDFRPIHFSKKFKKRIESSIVEQRVFALESIHRSEKNTHSNICSHTEKSYIYYARDHSDDNNIFIYIHGGGFVFYDATIFSNLMFDIVNLNDAPVYSIQYPKFPESSIADIMLSLELTISSIVKKNTEKTIHFIGDSIGGFLSFFFYLKYSHTQSCLATLIYPTLNLDNFFPSYIQYGKYLMLDSDMMLFFKSNYKIFFKGNHFNPSNMCLPYDLQKNISIFAAGCDVLVDEAQFFFNNNPFINFNLFSDLPHDFMLYHKFPSSQLATSIILKSLGRNYV